MAHVLQSGCRFLQFAQQLLSSGEKVNIQNQSNAIVSFAQMCKKIFQVLT